MIELFNKHQAAIRIQIYFLRESKNSKVDKQANLSMEDMKQGSGLFFVHELSCGTTSVDSFWCRLFDSSRLILQHIGHKPNYLIVILEVFMNNVNSKIKINAEKGCFSL